MSSALPSAPATAVDRARRGLLTRPWVRVLGVYALSRAYSSLLLGGMFLLATALHWPFASVRKHPTFFTFSGSWDAWFYRSIAEHGYPALLPIDEAGHVLPNSWAFLPVFPILERAVAGLTGVPTYTAGTIVATVAAGGAAIVLERLLAARIGECRALWAVALFVFGPLGFLLQVAYAESVFLLLVFAALLAVQRQRYLALIPLVILAAFTRPGAIAIPAAVGLQLAAQWFRDRRAPRGLRRAIGAVIVTSAACLAWPLVADAVTGQPGAYVHTELAWWTGWVGRPDFVPFTPWFLIASRWLGPPGVVLALTLASLFVLWIVRASRRELGTTVRAYGLAHVLYLTAVFLPQFSLPRLLMPLAPLLGASTFTATTARARRWLLCAAAAQPAGVVLLWFLSYP